MPSQQQQQQKAIKLAMRIFNGTYPLSFEILRRHSWRLRKNNFYLTVSERLASPGGTKFLKPIEEMLKEELNVFLTSLS